MQKQYWDTVARAWGAARPQGLWRLHSDVVNSTLYARWLPAGRGARLLKTDLFDEACSAGLYALLASRAQGVVGMDVSGVILHAARSRHPGLHAVGADVRHLPFAEGVFDVVISNSTLDHFAAPPDLVASLRELWRVLGVGGQLLLTLDNPANPLIALRNALPFRLLHRLRVVPYYVGATYGPRRLQALLRRIGFEVIEVDAVMHCPRVLAVALARLLERHARPETQGRFLRALLACERLSCWPTRFFTGHFVAVRARKSRRERQVPSTTDGQ